MKKDKKLKFICVAAARPNFMKIAPLMDEIKKHKNIEPVLVHTGQHYDYNMSGSFFEELDIPKPDYNLGVKASTHGKQTGETMIEFEKVCLKENPDLVIVVGDVNATIATALTAKKLHIPVAHIESGLRSRDMKMPEEINRILTDHISDYLFTTCKQANKNLINESISKDKIFFVGDIMVDTLLKHKEATLKQPILNKLGFKKDKFALLTLHRPSNVDSKESLEKILNIIKDVQDKIKIVYPIHPRTKKRLQEFNLWEAINSYKNIKIISPVPYLDIICLITNSKFVLSDSGGIQQETTTLKTPCLTMRQNTERPITIEKGTNTLVGTDKNKILREINKILDNNYKKFKQPKFWDGKTAQRIVKILNKNTNE